MDDSYVPVLRDYQRESIDAVMSARRNGSYHVGINLPTGTGKTIIQVLLIKQLLEKYQAIGQEIQVAFVVPFDHLVDNAVKTLKLVFPEDHIGVVKAARDEYAAPVCVISVQTATKQRRMEQLKARYTAVIVDEMDLFVAPKYRKVLEELEKPQALRVGLSATILREDRRSLSSVFGTLVYYKTIWEMIAKGWLAPLKGIRLDAKLDLSKVRQSRDGEYNDQDLASILSTEEAMALMFQGWKKYAGDRVTVAFTPTIAMAQECAKYWGERGVKADWICGAGSILPEKAMKEKMRAFTSGEVQIVFNAAKLVVGFDHPPISCVFLLRPTKSQRWYIQMSGRGTRVCKPDMYAECTKPLKGIVQETKEDCLILDVGGSSDLGLVQFADLFDLPPHLAKEINERMSQHPGESWGTDDLFTEHAELYHAKGLVASRINLVGASQYSWIKNSQGWILSLGSAGEISLTEHEQGFTVRQVHYEDVETQEECRPTDPPLGHSVQQGQSTITLRKTRDTNYACRETITMVQPEPIALEWAMALAEDRVKSVIKQQRGVKTLVDKTAKWRGQVCSEKQFFLLTKHLTTHPEVLPMLKYATYTDYQFHCPQEAQVTKGRAGELFELVKEQWAKAKAKRTV